MAGWSDVAGDQRKEKRILTRVTGRRQAKSAGWSDAHELFLDSEMEDVKFSLNMAK